MRTTHFTIRETKQFAKAFDKLVGSEERPRLHQFLAERPEAGALIRGSHGIRKLRWARPGSGKSGGVRVLYYYASEKMPLYLLSLFAKSEKANLSQREINELAKRVDALKARHEEENHEP